MRVYKRPLRLRQHPVFRQPVEQWESWIQTLENLDERHALVKVGKNPTVEIKNPTVPTVIPDKAKVEEVKAYYRDRLQKRMDEVELIHHKIQDDGSLETAAQGQFQGKGSEPVGSSVPSGVRTT